jgi:hypothetical protein
MLHAIRASVIILQRDILFTTTLEERAFNNNILAQALALAVCVGIRHRCILFTLAFFSLSCSSVCTIPATDGSPRTRYSAFNYFVSIIGREPMNMSNIITSSMIMLPIQPIIPYKRKRTCFQLFVFKFYADLSSMFSSARSQMSREAIDRALWRYELQSGSGNASCFGKVAQNL